MVLRSLRLGFVVVVASLAAAGPAAAAGPVRVHLPAPTGPHEIGTVSLHLVDRSRPDPWVPAQPYRELMVSAWYPAASTRGYDRAPHMAPRAAALFDRARAPGVGIPTGLVDWAATRTHAHEAAPVDRRGGRRPVLVYSPGSGDTRTWGTALVEEMASRGYVVLTVDHTHESPAVEFPDGSVRGNEPMTEALRQALLDETVPAFLKRMLDARLADARFLTDRLRHLPHGLAHVVDTRRIGFFGQSAGGILAAQGMHEDRRIAAGVGLDGTLEYNREPNGTNLMPVAVHGLDRPFLLMGRAGSDHTTEPSWRAFWANSRGWHRDLTLRGSRHQSYTDLEPLLPQTGLPADVVAGRIGTVDPARAVAAVRAHVASFFDRWLLGRDDHLLDGPSPHHPDIAFVP